MSTIFEHSQTQMIAQVDANLELGSWRCGGDWRRQAQPGARAGGYGLPPDQARGRGNRSARPAVSPSSA